MFVVRPVEINDLEDLRTLAASAQGGMTTLPNDKEFLKKKILDSLKAFDRQVQRPGGESYLFVLEDTDVRRIIGTAGAVSKVGGAEPYYSYRIETEVHADDALHVKKAIQVLHFIAKRSGPTEIGSLFLMPEYRGRGLARVLSLSRFLFMAEFPGRFDRTVISELRGVMDKKGRSPFWECVGRPFFGMDFATVDFLSGIGQKDFIAHLRPRHPIYVPLLPRQAQKVIGRVHREARPAQALLSEEGFVFNGEVDIFDAGPTFSAPLAAIRTVRESRKVKLGILEESLGPRDFLISNGRLDFRACAGAVRENPDGTVSLTKQAAEILKIKEGEDVRYVLLRGGPTSQSRREADG